MKTFYKTLFLLMVHVGLSAQYIYLDSTVTIFDGEPAYLTEFSYNGLSICDSIKSYDFNSSGNLELYEAVTLRHNDDKTVSEINFFGSSSILPNLSMNFDYFGDDSTTLNFKTYDGDMVDSETNIVQEFDQNGNVSIKYSLYTYDDGDMQALKDYYFYNGGRLDSVSSYLVDLSTKEENLYSKKNYEYDDENLVRITDLLDIGSGFVPYDLVEYSAFIDGKPSVTTRSSLSFFDNILELDSKDSTVYVDGLISEFYETNYYSDGPEIDLEKYNYVQKSKPAYPMTYLNMAFQNFNNFLGEDEFPTFVLGGLQDENNIVIDNIEYSEYDTTAKEFVLSFTDFYYYSDYSGSVNTKNYINANTTVYPNPTQDILKLTEVNDFSRYLIIDAEGKVVSGGALNDHVDVSGLNTGSYSIIFKSQNGEKVAMSRFVKVK